MLTGARVPTRIRDVEEAAQRIRRHALRMGEVQGQGYIGQALGVADILAVAYRDKLNLDPRNPRWDGRDRFLLSIGHYAIALYAALAEAGVIDVDELDTYGSDDSRLPMSGMASYTPGMEISGGSLGHGLGIAVGMALGLRHRGNGAHVVNLLSDGELNEGSTWEAAMAAHHHRLDRLVAVVDVNGLQADGPTGTVLHIEPIEAKWQAFGWRTWRIDGHDVDALLTAFDAAMTPAGNRPAVIICDTRPGFGVGFLEQREKAHFLRVEEHEWQLAHDELDKSFQERSAQ